METTRITIIHRRSRRVVMIVVALILVVVIGAYLFGPAGTFPMADDPAADHTGHTAARARDTTMADRVMLHLSPRDRILADVRTVRVDYRPMARTLQVAAGVEFDESSRRVVAARYGGRIERLFVNETGRYVRRGAPLMEIYSPEIVTAQKEYLIVRETAASALPMGDGSDTAYRSRMAERDRRLISVARRRLALLGMSDAQIAALDDRGEIAYTVTVFSPIAGTVVARAVTEGAYVNEGAALLDLADLSRVWVVANVPENDAHLIRPGMTLIIGGPGLGGATLPTRVDYVYPTVDAASRTVRVRAVLANHRGILRPGMYVNASIDLPARESLVVPVEAVVRTGRRDIVYVEVDTNMFEAREIVLGQRAGDYYQVIGEALHAGEMVVANGAYLLDSETRLGSGAADPHAGMNMGGTGTK